MNLQLPNQDFLEYLKFVGEQESQELLSPAAFTDQAVEFARHGLSVSGPDLPWSKVSDVIRLRPGQLSIWAGRSGSGKSVITGQAILHRLRGQRAVIASLEMRPEQTLYRMACQAAGCHPAPSWLAEWLHFLDGKLWIYDQLDSIESDRILGMVHYALGEMGADHVVIDSLTKCGFTRDDYDAQSKFINRLQWAAKRYNKHVHLICHMRKTSGHIQSDGKDDIRGAGEITDLADNVFILSRNREKEAAVRKQEQGASLNTGEMDKIHEPDAFLAVAKNREYGEEPNFGMWFHRSSQQFLPSDSKQPMSCAVVHDSVSRGA